ncbi:Rrf2 family transcriptional regulator [Conexibacter sp. DBS9H8]|uniref:Rrf2 family transcriptional regulator n=1 Tax=Conexibacter sp. DBS9H8 TaxID=2937801 RepID=UPI002010544A|nr:Rrf2 family transcriptional regulator [Conexibacter sp. DBS9H8]
MADFVDATVRDIDTRMAELQEELTRLEAARSALTGGRRSAGRPRGASTAGESSTEAPPARAATPRGKAASGSRRRGPGRPRGRRNGSTRANQALTLVQQRPGITIPQIAEELTIEPNYLYRVMPKLVSDGLVKRDGQGWHPVEGAATTTAE